MITVGGFAGIPQVRLAAPHINRVQPVAPAARAGTAAGKPPEAPAVRMGIHARMDGLEREVERLRRAVETLEGLAGGAK